MTHIRSLIWQYAQINGIPGFSQDNNKADRSYAKHFLKQFPHLTSRKAVNLSVARAMTANELNVRKWFAEYEQVLHDLCINSPEQIWSGDETGVQNVMCHRKKLLCVSKASCHTKLWQQTRGKPLLFSLLLVVLAEWYLPWLSTRGSESKSHGLGMHQLECASLQLQKLYYKTEIP